MQKAVDGVRDVPRCQGSTCVTLVRASATSLSKDGPISHRTREYSWLRMQFASSGFRLNVSRLPWSTMAGVAA